MYIIQFIHRNGGVDWLANKFFSKREAIRFARKHEDVIGRRYIIRRV